MECVAVLGAGFGGWRASILPTSKKPVSWSVYRRLLYKWRQQQLEPTEPGGIAAPDTREFTLSILTNALVQPLNNPCGPKVSPKSHQIWTLGTQRKSLCRDALPTVIGRRLDWWCFRLLHFARPL